MKKYLLLFLLFSACDEQSRAILKSRIGTDLKTLCEEYTSLTHGNASSDPCVAYWLRKIAEKR